MRKCIQCDLNYPNDQFYCVKCGLPTESNQEDEFLFYSNKKDYISVYHIKKSTLIFFSIRIILFVFLGVISFVFIDQQFWNFIFLISMLFFAYEQIINLLNGKVSLNLAEGHMISNIFTTIWMILISAFFILFTYFGGTPAKASQLANYDAYEPGHYYLVYIGEFTKVSHEVYRFVGILQNIFYIFMIISVVSIIVLSIYSYIIRRKSPHISQTKVN